jgi:hypothetical protein
MSPDLQAIRERLPELDAWWEPPVSQAKDDLESLLAEVERLRAALKRIANHPDARDSIVSIAATELDEQIAASE